MDEEIQRLLFHALPVGFVQAIAVGRLKNQHVAWRRWLRIAKNGHVGAAKIAAEEHGGRIAACRVFHPNGRRSQNMAGVVKGSCHAWGDLEHVSVSCTLKSSDELTNVIGIVEWSNTGFPVPPFILVDVAAVTHLYSSRVFEHKFRQICGGSGEVHFSGEAVLLSTVRRRNGRHGHGIARPH